MAADGRWARNLHPEVIWYPNGQTGFSGRLLALYRRIDALFSAWAAESGAREYAFPTFIPAAELAKLDYFRSFPHLVTFPAVLDPDPDNIQRFSRSPMRPAASGDGALRLTDLAPVRDVLTPAACYHVYIAFQGQALDEARLVTTRATCFRREERYTPLERQWSFSMREIVCLGSNAEVRQFLASSQEKVDAFFRSIDLPVAWKEATDPFFDPARNPKYLMQRIEPVKTEMVFEDRLAIGSINFHQDTFGRAFRIRRGGGDAFSGCVAFGVERWIAALLARFGPDERNWPAPPAPPAEESEQAPLGSTPAPHGGTGDG
jgi:seryl-tRNA synthetase